MAEMLCNDDSRVYTLTMQHFPNIINIDWIFIPIGILWNNIFVFIINKYGIIIYK